MRNKQDIFHNIHFQGFFIKSPEVIASSISTYWETDVDLILLAVNDFRNIRDEFFAKNIDFFSSQIKVEYHKPVLIRLDSDFIYGFLNDTLKSNASNFKLRDITPLEITILNNFCEFLYKQIDELLIPPKVAKMTTKSEQNINLLYLLTQKSGHVSKIMISIPQDRIEMKELVPQQAFTDDEFLEETNFVKVRAGYSRLTLKELQNLSAGDIIVLEKSKINELTLISGDFKKKFQITSSEGLEYNFDDEEFDEENEQETIENEENEEKMNKNLWDDIQIELSAEFSKVKMTIGELKQITKGQIVDLGSVFENEIALYIEDKKVATGELIIINDKYAVKLDEVLSSNVVPQESSKNEIKEETKETPEEIPENNQIENEPKLIEPQEEVEDEEFDYSDFEEEK